MEQEIVALLEEIASSDSLPDEVREAARNVRFENMHVTEGLMMLSRIYMILNDMKTPPREILGKIKRLIAALAAHLDENVPAEGTEETAPAPPLPVTESATQSTQEIAQQTPPVEPERPQDRQEPSAELQNAQEVPAWLYAPLPQANGPLWRLSEVRLLEAVRGSSGPSWFAVLIEAGLSKNNVNYKPQVLRQATALFEGARIFADHPTAEEIRQRPERSVHDVAGWISEARWDESRGAIVGRVNILSAHYIAPIIKEACERGRPDLIQLSLYGRGDKKLVREGNRVYWDVEVIKEVHSVDLVTYAAAGGRIIAASNGGDEMDLNNLTAEDLKTLLEAQPALKDQLRSMLQPPEPPASPATPDVAKLATVESKLAELEEALKRERCANLAMSQIAASGLPEVMQARLRERFTNRIFEPAELEKAIKEEQDIYNALLAHADVRPRVQVVADSNDNFIDALTATILDKPYNGQVSFKSLQRAYCTFHNINPLKLNRSDLAYGIVRESIGFDPIQNNLREASGFREAISWGFVFGTAMNRALLAEYNIPVWEEWRKIVSTERTLNDFRAQEIISIGYYGALPAVEEGGTYQYVSSPTDVKGYYSPTKYGGLESYTWEQAINDDMGALQRIPKNLARAAKFGLYQFVFNFLANNATCTFDGKALFHADHANLGSSALSSAQLSAAKQAMRSQTPLSNASMPLAIVPKYLLVPNELMDYARKLIDSEYDVEEVANATAGRANPHRGQFELIVVDYWSDPNNWFVVADPNMVPTIQIGFLNGQKEPELFTEAPNTGAHMMADKFIIKIRFVYGGAIEDYRGMWGAIVS